MHDAEIVITSDGSHTLLNKAMNETYHSIHGALAESQHVYINNGLDFFNLLHSPDTINILEIGFGTGLNALLTFDYTSHHTVKIKYTTLEAFPLEREIWTNLNYASTTDLKLAYAAFHDSSWDTWIHHLNFNFFKIKNTLQKVIFNDLYDVVYFDAFAPSKQPEMWTLPMLDKIVKTMRIDGVLVTYCAKGQFKRDLKSLGMRVESLPGPVGKMEMVRATKLSKPN